MKRSLILMVILWSIQLLLPIESLAKWILVTKVADGRTGPGESYEIDGRFMTGQILELPESFHPNSDTEWLPTQEVKRLGEKVSLVEGFYEAGAGKRVVGEEIAFVSELNKVSFQKVRFGKLVEILNAVEIYDGTPYSKGAFEVKEEVSEYGRWIHKTFVALFDTTEDLERFRAEERKGEEEARQRENEEWRKKREKAEKEKRLEKQRAEEEAIRKWHAKIDALQTSQEIKNAIRQKKITLGMTTEEVVLSWGKPNDKNTSVGSWGKREQWIYRVGELKADYLYFENGILTSYQLAGR